jgi:hypothetical protein
MTNNFLDSFKQTARKVGPFILNKAWDVIGICTLFLVSIIISIGIFLFNVFMWFIAVSAFGWILCFILAWLCHAYLGH